MSDAVEGTILPHVPNATNYTNLWERSRDARPFEIDNPLMSIPGGPHYER